ncbi:MAG: TatD family hydrolase [Thermoprotei archaeon]
MLFDGHAHLDSEQFKGNVRDIASECNVLIVNASVDLRSSLNTLKLASELDNVFPAIGFHPEFVERSQEVPQVLELVEYAVEVSEVGLDYYWIKDDVLRKKEIEVLSAFLERAERLSLPVVIHSRGGNKDLLNILPSYRITFAIHAFEGSLKHANAIVDLGGFISFPPIIVRDRSRADIAKSVDLSHILTETDSPFMGAEKGEINRPCNVIKAVKKIAELKGLPPEEVEAIIERNALRFFDVSNWDELKEKKREKMRKYLERGIAH